MIKNRRFSLFLTNTTTHTYTHNSKSGKFMKSVRHLQCRGLERYDSCRRQDDFKDNLLGLKDWEEDLLAGHSTTSGRSCKSTRVFDKELIEDLESNSTNIYQSFPKTFKRHVG